ncbi:MAG: response regulator [Elusimicrobia bacterium]|nr:response regulator [Elusimicrobiota bacterium]
MKERVYIIEDDPEMREVTRLVLERAGYRVSEAGTAEESLVAIQRELPDLVVSDIQLPGISGIRFCEILRKEERTKNIPIILLTVLGKNPDKVRGLKTGADDYITKPYDPSEFLARVEALLRRTSGAAREPSKILEFRKLRLDVDRREVELAGKSIAMRRKEFDLLALFLEHPGRLLTRARINKALYDEDVIVTENALTSHIKNLRSLLGPYGNRIETLVGEGYRFNDE